MQNGLYVQSPPERVMRAFAHIAKGPVTRYELPRLRAFNFVIEKALGGGASRSLRLDTQGKALGVALLELCLSVPEDDSRPSRRTIARPAPRRAEHDHDRLNRQCASL